MLKPIKQLLERNASIIAIFLTLAIIFLSLVSLKGVVKINVSNSDKYGHFIAYTTLGLSWFFAFKEKTKAWVYITVALIVFGMVLEVLQGSLTTHRTADWFDALANTSGVLIAYFAAHLWIKK